MTRIGVLLVLAAALAAPARAQEGQFLSEQDAPGAVFPDADHFDRQDVESTPDLREKMSARLDGSRPSMWEEHYAVFAASRGSAALGRAVVVEEIGKHRPITFIVGIKPDGSVQDVAVMAYREAYGGEVRTNRFLRQYRGKAPTDRLRNGDDIKNIAGATLSVDAASRAVRKAQALAATLDASPTRRPRGGGRPVRGRWLAALLVAVPCVIRAAPRTQVHYVMGTYLRITADGPGAAAAMTGCFQDARRLDDVFSRWSTTSELARLNATPGAEAMSEDMAGLLARSLALTAATGGAFDVRVGPLTALWRRPVPPSEPEVEAARAASGGDAVRVRGDHVTLAAGARLDFDGIAKGWAVDACAARLRAAGVSSALVSFGESSLFALGAPAGASRWRLAVRGPVPDTTVGWLGLRDAGVSVSATYGSDGQRAGHAAHVLDPRTGYPLRDDAVAVVVAPSATDAEAWTKALLVWGGDGVSRVRRGGAAAAIHVQPDAIRADVVGPAITWEPLAAPRIMAAREEPLR